MVDSSEIQLNWYHHAADFFNLFEVFVSTSFLDLAYGFQQGGLVVGAIGIPVTVVLMVHGVFILVEVKDELISQICQSIEQKPGATEETKIKTKGIRKTLKASMTYSDIAFMLFGKWMSLLMNVLIISTQLGFGISFHIFIGNTLYELVMDTTAVPGTGKLVAFLLVISPLPVFIVFVLIRRVRQIGILSALACILAVIVFWLIIAYVTRDFSVADDITQAKLHSVPVFIGIINAEFLITSMILPVQNSMEGNYHNFKCYFIAAATLFTVMSTSVAITSYLKFGESTQQIIVQNLHHGPLKMAVELLTVISLMFIYPLNIYPAIEMLEDLVFSPVKSDSGSSEEETSSLLKAKFTPISTWKGNILRIVTTVVIALIAGLAIDIYAYVMALIGAIGTTPLAFIFPFVFHIKLVKGTAPWWVVLKDVLIIVIGIVITVMGTVVVIKTITDHWRIQDSP